MKISNLRTRRNSSMMRIFIFKNTLMIFFVSQRLQRQRLRKATHLQAGVGESNVVSVAKIPNPLSHVSVLKLDCRSGLLQPVSFSFRRRRFFLGSSLTSAGGEVTEAVILIWSRLCRFSTRPNMDTGA